MDQIIPCSCVPVRKCQAVLLHAPLMRLHPAIGICTANLLFPSYDSAHICLCIGIHQPDRHIHRSIEPYNYMKLEDFAPGYISGLPAEHYSIEANEIVPRALNRIKGFGVEQCKTYILGSHTGTSEIIEEAGCLQSVELKQITYAMVPVWICSYTFQGKKHMVYVNGQTGKTDGEVVSSEERLKSYAVVIFLATFLEYFSLILFLLSLNGWKLEDIAVMWFIFISFFVGSLTGNFSNMLAGKRAGKRNGKKETVNMYADIEYVKKDYVKPKNIMIRRTIIGTLLLPIAVAYSRSIRLPFVSSPSMPEAALFTLVLSVVWTAIFMGIHVKKEKEQKPAEYNDYLNMSITDVLASSEHVY